MSTQRKKEKRKIGKGNKLNHSQIVLQSSIHKTETKRSFSIQKSNFSNLCGLKERTMEVLRN